MNLWNQWFEIWLPFHQLLGRENILSNCLSPWHRDVKKSCQLCNPTELIREAMKIVIHLLTEL